MILAYLLHQIQMPGEAEEGNGKNAQKLADVQFTALGDLLADQPSKPISKESSVN